MAPGHRADRQSPLCARLPVGLVLLLLSCSDPARGLLRVSHPAAHVNPLLPTVYLAPPWQAVVPIPAGGCRRKGSPVPACLVGVGK